MGTFSGFLFDQITKIIGGKVLFLCKITDQRYSQFLGFSRFYVSVQGRLEIFDNAQVYGIAGDELPVVKTGAIIQEKTNVR